jgi:hypothetical protein
MAPVVEFTTAVDEGLQSAPDADVLEAAWQGRWLVVSHDVTTLRALAEDRVAGGGEMHGVFLAAQHRSVREITEALVLIGEASEFEEWNNLVTFLPLS